MSSNSTEKSDAGAVQDGEKMLKAVFDTIPLAIFVLKARKILFVNASAEAIFGWKPSELIGKSTEMLYRNEHEFETIGNNFYVNLKKENIHREIFPTKHKDGRDIICDITATRIKGSLDEEEFVATYEDITNRLAAEKELKESEEKYRTYVENTHELVFNITADGKILNGNKTWYETFGYSKEELDTLDIFSLIHADFKKQYEDIFKKATLNEPTANARISFLTKDGRTLYLEGNLVPRTFYGQVITVTGFYRDMTENVRTQKLIKDKIEELEKFNSLTVNRELKMIELKDRVTELEAELITLLKN
ncbi:MAG: PAS domain-containing protein [Minisyncoccia bacterium]